MGKLPSDKKLIKETLEIIKLGAKKYDSILEDLKSKFNLDDNTESFLQKKLDCYIFDLLSSKLVELDPNSNQYSITSDYNTKITNKFEYTLKELRELSDEKWERPKIPQDTIYQLWGSSGGLCYMCGKSLWEVDQNLVNISEIAHIIPFSPYGPRGGNPQKSKKLRIEFSNLLLLCSYHHKFIDSYRYIDIFTEKKLIEIKEEREMRVKNLLSVVDKKALRVLSLTSKIGDQLPKINKKDIIDSLIPDYYPEEVHPITLPLNHTYDQEYFNVCIRDLDCNIDTLLKKIEHEKSPIAIFSLASIPFLIYAGRKIGNKYPIEPIPYFPDKEKWGWDSSNDLEKLDFDFEPISKLPSNTSDVIVLVNISAPIPETLAKATAGDFPCINFNVKGKEGKRNIIRQKSDLENFIKKWIEFIDLLRNYLSNTEEGFKSRIHLFSAIPTTVALKIGMNFQPTAEVKIKVYDFDSVNKRYYFALEF